MITKIKKRSGEIAEFTPAKITAAIQKAYLACQVFASEEKLNEITKRAAVNLGKQFPGEISPAVEDVQNIVERILMELGDFTVAKAYIIYRYEHTKIREEKRKDVLEKIERHDLTVVKRSGKPEKFSSKKLKKSLNWALNGLEKEVDLDLIVLRSEEH